MTHSGRTAKGKPLFFDYVIVYDIYINVGLTYALIFESIIKVYGNVLKQSCFQQVNVKIHFIFLMLSFVDGD